MQVIDSGHQFLLDSYDGEQENRLVFMKREGEGYPFNVGHHAGTNCQEVIRVLISRLHYLQRQIPCAENLIAIGALREALWQFEKRAALRHGRTFTLPKLEIENHATCRTCGHVQCAVDHHSQERQR